MANINVMQYIVGHALPQWKTVGQDDLTALQDLVGGYIEMLRMRHGLACICNEDGGSLGLPIGFAVNSTVGLQPIRGNFFICRVNGSKFASLHEGDIQTVLSEVIPR